METRIVKGTPYGDPHFDRFIPTSGIVQDIPSGGSVKLQPVSPTGRGTSSGFPLLHQAPGIALSIARPFLSQMPRSLAITRVPSTNIGKDELAVPGLPESSEHLLELSEASSVNWRHMLATPLVALPVCRSSSFACHCLVDSGHSYTLCLQGFVVGCRFHVSCCCGFRCSCFLSRQLHGDASHVALYAFTAYSRCASQAATASCSFLV